MLQRVLKENPIIFTNIKHNPYASKRPKYKEDKFYDYHMVKGISTNGCKILK